MATWQDIAKLITGAAPMVGAAIGGPAGATIGMGVKVLAGMLGITKEDPTPDEIHAAISADPDFALKAKALDYNFQMAMRQADKEEFMAALADVAGARTRQIEHEKATGHTDYNLYVLAWVVVVGFFAIIYALMRTTVFVEDAQPVLFMLLGTLASGFGMVLQFFFGSTKSSSAKNDLLANSIPMGDVQKMLNGKK